MPAVRNRGYHVKKANRNANRRSSQYSHADSLCPRKSIDCQCQDCSQKFCFYDKDVVKVRHLMLNLVY